MQRSGFTAASSIALSSNGLYGMIAADFDAAGRRYDHLRPGIGDAIGELMGSKAAEDDGMNRADARACQHRDDRLRHHRHVDDDPIAFLNSLRAKHAGKARYLIEQLAIGERLNGSRNRTVVNQRRLIRPPAFDVTIERVVASIEHSAGEPAIERRPRVIEHPVPLFIPMHRFGRLGPEILRIVQPAQYRRRHSYLSWRSLRI